MKNYKNSARLLLGVSYFLFGVLIALVFLLPKGAFWYTEIKHRPDTLPTVLISTCYPCVPFAFVALLAIRQIAKNILDDKIFTKATQKSVFVFGLCCLMAGLVMFFAGFFYFPFFIASGAALFCALIAKVFSDVFAIHISGGFEPSDEAEEPKKTAEDGEDAEKGGDESEPDSVNQED